MMKNEDFVLDSRMSFIKKKKKEKKVLAFDRWRHLNLLNESETDILFEVSTEDGSSCCTLFIEHRKFIGGFSS